MNNNLPRRLCSTLISSVSKYLVYLFRRSGCRNNGSARANSINRTAKNGEAYRNIFISCHATAICFREADVPFASDTDLGSWPIRFSHLIELVTRAPPNLARRASWGVKIDIVSNWIHTHVCSFALGLYQTISAGVHLEKSLKKIYRNPNVGTCAVFARDDRERNPANHPPRAVPLGWSAFVTASSTHVHVGAIARNAEGWPGQVRLPFRVHCTIAQCQGDLGSIGRPGVFIGDVYTYWPSAAHNPRTICTH